MTSPYRQTHISLYGHPQRFFSAARPATAVLCWLSLPAPPPHETPDQYRRARPGARHRLLRTGFRADPYAPPGAGGGEMSGAQAPIYLLEKAADTPAAGATRQPRDYARHWTPVHLDVVVDDVDAAVTRAVAAGARLEPGRHACLGPHRPPERPVRPWHLPAAVPGPGLRRTGRTGAALPAVSEADFEDLLALRIAAMRESLERLGRFDPERARSAPPSARNTPGQSSWKENASASTRCARTATACAWTTCTCTRRPRRGLGGRSGACWRRPTHRACRCAWAPCAAATRTASTSATASSRSKKANGTSNTCARAGSGANASKPCDGGFAATQCRPPSATDRAK